MISVVPDHPPVDLSVARERLWSALTAADEYAAAAVVFEALEHCQDQAAALGGPTAAHESVLLDLIAPVQHRVGSEWAANRLTVAAEHSATAIHDRVIAAIAHHLPVPPGPSRGRITVACVDGEWHALPARLLAETLRLRGWRVDFLGAQVPTPHLLAHVHGAWPDAVALSSSIPTRLPAAHAAITACQLAGVPVMVGGAAFGPDGRYAERLGADAWAADARGAADLLAAGLGRTARRCDRQPIDDLPHLADQEYTMVARDAQRLVRAAWGELTSDADPAGQPTGYDPAEDIAHLVDFLVAALYTDDPGLFAGFALWTAQVGAARDIPVSGRYRVLDFLSDRLTDFPRASQTIRAARTALEEAA